MTNYNGILPPQGLNRSVAQGYDVGATFSILPVFSIMCEPDRKLTMTQAQISQ